MFGSGGGSGILGGRSGGSGERSGGRSGGGEEGDVGGSGRRWGRGWMRMGRVGRTCLWKGGRVSRVGEGRSGSGSGNGSESRNGNGGVGRAVVVGDGDMVIGRRETTSVSPWTGGTAGAGKEVEGCPRSLQHHRMVFAGRKGT